MRGFVVGILLLFFLTVTMLSLRPGGLRRQLRFAARRLRLALVLGGIYILANTLARIAFSVGWVGGWVVDWGPPAVAIVLAATFMILGQDPELPLTGASGRAASDETLSRS